MWIKKTKQKLKTAQRLHNYRITAEIITIDELEVDIKAPTEKDALDLAKIAFETFGNAVNVKIEEIK